MDGDCSVCYCVKETELVSSKLFVRMSLKPHSEQRLARMLHKLSYNFFFQKRTMLRIGHYVQRGFNDDDRLNKRS